MFDRKFMQIALGDKFDKLNDYCGDFDLCMDEIIIEGVDYLGLREEMYEKGYLLYNRCDDGRLYFVRECILVDLLEKMKQQVGGPLTSIHHHMDYDLLMGLEQLLREPLDYEWKWRDFRGSQLHGSFIGGSE